MSTIVRCLLKRGVFVAVLVSCLSFGFGLSKALASSFKMPTEEEFSRRFDMNFIGRNLEFVIYHQNREGIGEGFKRRVEAGMKAVERFASEQKRENDEILADVFDDIEKDGNRYTHMFRNEERSEAWWDNFYSLRKRFLGK
jgi:hypothetical protein